MSKVINALLENDLDMVLGKEFESSVRSLIEMGYKFDINALEEAQKDFDKLLDDAIDREGMNVVDMFSAYRDAFWEAEDIERSTTFKAIRSVRKMNKMIDIESRHLPDALRCVGEEEFDEEMESYVVRVNVEERHEDDSIFVDGINGIAYNAYYRVYYIAGGCVIDHNDCNFWISAGYDEFLKVVKDIDLESFSEYLGEFLEGDEDEINLEDYMSNHTELSYIDVLQEMDVRGLDVSFEYDSFEAGTFRY